MRYFPVTPGGSVLVHLESPSEQQAWANLLKDIQPLYGSRKELEERGYTVEVATA